MTTAEHPDCWIEAKLNQELVDGSLILAAVRVHRIGERPYWDIALLRVDCDEGRFRLLDAEHREPWGWEWCDVKFWKRVMPPDRSDDDDR